MNKKTTKHRQIWQNKKILREVYSDWYRQIIKDLSQIDGPTIELGAGSGNFKEFKPDIIAADIESCEWLDMCFDAHQMPFKDGSVANLVLVDVLHHLADPFKFFQESERVLTKGGRIIMIEPFPSLISLPLYSWFHPEPFIFDQDCFVPVKINNKDPWKSNQAIAYLLFYKFWNKFRDRLKNLSIVKRQRFSICLWPASGGFDNRQMIPNWSISLFRGLEWLLYPLRPWLAWRTYIVLSKQPTD